MLPFLLMIPAFVLGWFAYKLHMAWEVTRWLRKNGIDPDNFRLKVQTPERPNLSKFPRNEDQN